MINRGVKKFRYIYDFGDGWEHEIILGVVRIDESAVNHPVLVGGARCGPPEDVGGTCGYLNFLDILRDPSHEEHEEFMEWIGGKFDPEAFDKVHVSEMLKRNRIPF